MRTTTISMIVVVGLVVSLAVVGKATPMGTAWTYQGRLMDANDTADGEYDFQFKLYDAPNGGFQQGSTIDVNDLDVIDGYFTVELDFGSSVFDGNDRWLQIGVRQVANPFTILSPRQEVTPSPYALYAASGPGVPVPLELSGSIPYPGTVVKVTNTGTGRGVHGIDDSSGNYGYLGDNVSGVLGYSSSDYGVRGLSISGYGVYGECSQGHAGYFNGDVYVTDDVSALSFTDRTPYPKNLATAYEAVMSMERLPNGQYNENNKEAQLDHSKLSDFVRSKDGNRDLSATVSCHNEVLKDLINKQEEIVKAHTYIEYLKKQNELLEARLVKLEAMISKEPLK